MISIVGCALLAHMGFQGRINTVGVDLGTTFSVIAVNEHGTVRVIGRDGKYGMDIDGNKKAGASLYPGWEKSTSTNVYNVYNVCPGVSVTTRLRFVVSLRTSTRFQSRTRESSTTQRRG